MTSAIAPLVSPRNRIRQALSRCSEFFKPVFSKTPGTQTVKDRRCGTLRRRVWQSRSEARDKPSSSVRRRVVESTAVSFRLVPVKYRLSSIGWRKERQAQATHNDTDEKYRAPAMQPTETRTEEKRESECRFPFSSVGGAEKRRSVKALDETWLKRWHVKS